MAAARAGRLAALLLAVTGCKNITAGRAPAGAVGAACTSPAECRAGPAPECLGMPEGYCSFACGAGGGDDCGGEAVCEGLDTHARYCLDGCLVRNGNDDCRTGYRCAARPDIDNIDGEAVGVCRPACARDGDCERGTRCETATGSCLAPGGRAVGEPCLRAAECSGAMCLLGPGFRGGMCSARCGSAEAPCPDRGVCVAVAASPFCALPCDPADPAACRADEGYRCRPLEAGLAVCLPGCRTDADCGAGTRCETASGDCVAAPAGAPLGGACDTDADCERGACAQDWPDGACTSPCPCPADARVPCARAFAPGRCVAPCAADGDCRAGYLCQGGACQPPCTTDADCGFDRCDAALGLCRTLAPPAATRTEVLTLAEAVPVSGAPGEALVVTVPENTLGLGLVVDGHGGDELVLAELVDPDGRVLYDWADPLRSAARFFPADQTVAAVLPVTPETAPRPGAYRFRLVKAGPTRYVRVRAVFKTGAASSSARLDANFVFVGTEGIDAGRAPGDRDFQLIVERFRELLGQAGAGVQLGTVRLCDAPAAEARHLAVVDPPDGPGSELSRLFELSGQVGAWGCEASAGLNFFLVDEIQGGRDGYTILGVAGGIPGPAGVHGTPHSGVAVTLAGYRRSAERVSRTLAHEAGHYLGLFHTTEAEGTLFDPLDDTPRCERDRDVDGSGLLDFTECLGAGAENLMFWASGRTARTLSPHQGFVVRGSPALR
jgi:hypothetical protein